MRVLMCPPDHYDVIDVKNPHMHAAAAVDAGTARAQWEALQRTFSSIGLAVETVPAIAGCEDMVFAANQAFTGPGRRCVLSDMRHASRRREVAGFERWFAERGWDTVHANGPFEGGGDAIWHPGRNRIWMGHGFRSEPGALEGLFSAEIIELALVDERFYHLDTCFCALDCDTVLIHPPAFLDQAPILAGFARVVRVDPNEAFAALACNAAAFFGTDVVIDRRAQKTIAQLRRLGYRVHEVDTGEFLKSGGSVYCLKHALFDEGADAGL